MTPCNHVYCISNWVVIIYLLGINLGLFMFLSSACCHFFFLSHSIFHQPFLTFFGSRSSPQLHPTAWTEYPLIIIQIDLASSTIFLAKKVTIIYTTIFATGIRIQPFAYITTNHEEEQSKSKTFF
jgi:hypothetical protein